MFTVIALLLSIVGIPLFNWKGRPIGQFKLINHAGAYVLVIAGILWCVVFLALIWRAVAWLWVHAP